MKIKYEESSKFWHEALDRSFVACDHFHEYVERHPAVQNDNELREEAAEILQSMLEFYQHVAKKDSEFDKNLKRPLI